MRILSVDDDELMLELLAATLAAAGHDNVTTALSADEALAACVNAAEPFECILLDIQMPGKSGIELCEVLRKTPRYKTVPIIMLTAMTDRTYVENAFDAGATDYLNKPFDSLELSARIRTAAAHNAQTRQISAAQRQISNMKSEMEEMSRFPFEASIAFTDVEGVVDHLVLENFILQMSKSVSYKCAAAAIKIEQFVQMYDNLATSDLIGNLTGVARAISGAFIGQKIMLSYYGSGVFVCISERGAEQFSAKKLEQIQTNLNAMKINVGGGYAGRATLTMGEPMSSTPPKGRLFSQARKMPNIIERAIDNVVATNAMGKDAAASRPAGPRTIH